MNIGGLNFRVLSPSVYNLVGAPISIIYGSPDLLGDRAGWYICDADGAAKHRKPFESRDAAIKFMMLVYLNDEVIA